MHPDLFSFPVPSFLQGFLPSQITVHTYGFMIALGALLAFWFLHSRMKKRFGVSLEEAQNLFILLVLGGFVGGKLLFYFENPSYYFGTPSNMMKNLGGGFVFYGSLIFCIPIVIWFIKRHKIPAMQMLDLVAITTCIVHIFGRMGCFGAGCCHGLVTEGFFSVIFTDPSCLAKPLNTPLHPTQLYSIALISSILIILLIVKKFQKFDGQLFLVYMLLYAIGRSIIEEFRGDFKRGYVFDGFLSHSQLISIILVVVVGVFYAWLWKKKQKN
ncbi:MAG: phosphatidylglycerol:prolipoprotein diacylglycerol transferase [Flammeovirgaceae bacterium]|jgi:phosphatidylglycerol:prolipoprotein diacylglycerol transferase